MVDQAEQRGRSDDPDAPGKYWREQDEESDREDPLAGGPLALELRESWEDRFGRSAPIEIEIGFGYGNFLLEYAALRPEIGLVGLEIKASLVEHVDRRARKLGRTNIVVMRGNARRLLPVLFGPGSVRAVHIQFPDPWWKKRHRRRRIVDPSFARLLHRLLEDEGRVYLRTDVRAYGEAMVETFEDGSGRFENVVAPRSFADDDGLGVPSNRERRYLAGGTPVYRLIYHRR